jgi:hypothetical protein
VCDVDDILSVLDDSNENLLYDSSSGSDYEIFDADMSESESGTSDSGSKTLVTCVSSNWLQVTDCDCKGWSSRLGVWQGSNNSQQ